MFLALRRELLDRGRDADLPFLVMHAAWLECLAADYPAARRLADEALETATLARSMSAHALAFSAFLEAHTGDADLCRAHAREALRATGPAENCLVLQWCHGALGQLELGLGDAVAARDALEPLTSFYEREPFAEPALIAFFPDAVEALVTAGDVQRATMLTDQLESSGMRFERPSAVAAGERCRALILAAEHDLTAAHAAADRAVTAQELLPLPLELARALLIRGRIERRLKRKAAARASLSRALEICDEIGARLWAERARAELARLGRRPDPDELTATEERVADSPRPGSPTARSPLRRS